MKEIKLRDKMALSKKLYLFTVNGSTLVFFWLL